jgi:hypothetical protein
LSVVGCPLIRNSVRRDGFFDLFCELKKFNRKPLPLTTNKRATDKTVLSRGSPKKSCKKVVPVATDFNSWFEIPDSESKNRVQILKLKNRNLTRFGNRNLVSTAGAAETPY